MVGRRPSSRTFAFRISILRGRLGLTEALVGSAWSIFALSASLNSAARAANGAAASASRIE